MSTAERFSPVPKDLDEVKELLSKLSIEDLRAFCFTFGLSQDGRKPNLIELLTCMKYYTGKQNSCANVIKRDHN